MSAAQDQPTVSVVMGCYDADPAHLREALDSVLAQTYPHVEVIVVDDGSTRADTVALLDSYEGRVRVLRQENAGVAAARNAAVGVARGELIQVFDSDDRMGEDLIEQGVMVLAHPEVQIAFSSAEVFGEESRFFEAGEEYRLADILDTNHITGCAMVRRARWEAVGGQWAALRDGFEDYEFWIRILRDGGVARRTPTARFHYRVRPGSRSTRITAGAMERTRAVILESNAMYHDVLLRAAFETMDRLNGEKREYVGYVRQWQRRARPLIAVRDAVRSASQALKPGARGRVTPEPGSGYAGAPERRGKALH